MSRRGARLWLLAALVAGGAYLAPYLNRGWYPHDEGTLGQTAERVMGGEVPHRDFDDPYTGLLTYLHAGAFKLGGVRLSVLRIPLFVATLLGLAAFFRIALRLVEPPAAAALTVLAVIWSVPNYPASMPSWYNLVLALLGTLALVRWDETRSPGWLFLAGLAGGISFLFKLSGLFYLAGAGLFLLYATRNTGRNAAGGSIGASLSITILLAAFVGALWQSVSPYHGLRVLIHFVGPGALIALGLALREWAPPRERARARLGSLVAAGAPFVAGVALPVALLAGWFAANDALGATIQDVFIVPFRRLQFANMMPPAPFWILAAVPLVVLLRPRADWKAPKWRAVGWIAGGALTLLLVMAAQASFPHRLIWQSLRPLIPIVGLVAAAVLAFPRLAGGWKPGAERRFVLLALVTVTTSLIQFPFSAPIYFLYVAPLLLLAVIALVQGIARTPRPLGALTAAFYAAFGALLVTPGAVRGMGFRYETPHRTVLLDLPRAGLRVNPDEAELYSQVVRQLQEWAGAGLIWAGPDAPELYFLGGFPNRTRSLFNFLGPEEPAALLQSLDRSGIRAIAINQRPSFSMPLPPELIAALRARFPEGATFGRFELRRRN